ncbi:glycoside hydrolase family 32 protein [Actinoplanes bogorensis]|uniref:beta-fructofuranosidase n=1 Tax=Paractinoplanes bogorensis TaxID=1610840 RepID=A0ABS5YSH2_9ACTN|nr:glycoside hydrolase family 32 protein [Actinoplanes bogorensis]MBU2666388.1 glycoside hydrolase family 32 protein [Actinoplanes bogorensis]
MHPDPAFPRFHGRPDRGWVNDPNGCSYFDGRYHVFFQHNPDEPVHDRITWGHMSSADLVSWRSEPIALVPRAGELDAYGCWTGCVVDDGGVPTAVYSAVADESHRAAVLLARGSSGRWEQSSTPVVPPLDRVRDPFVFTVDGHRYAIQGGRDLLLYGCDDLTSWEPLGTLLDAHPLAPAEIWECPNLIRFGDRWVLLVSLWNDGELTGVRYLVGDLTWPGPRFRPVTGGLVDRGPAFYAPQVLAMDDRVLMWAWSWELGRDPAEHGWAGCLTYARELTLAGDVLISRPARELDGLRGPRTDGLSAPGLCFEALLGPGPAELWLDDTLVAEFEVPASALQPPRVLVDGSMVEIFDGTATPYTTRAYPTATSRWHIRGATDHFAFG